MICSTNQLNDFCRMVTFFVDMLNKTFIEVYLSFFVCDIRILIDYYLLM